MTRWSIRSFARFNGLSLAAFGGFLIFIVLQSVFGWQVRNSELTQAGQVADSYWHYLGTGHFGEATFENWESEFLQMGTYVLLTAYLVQRGSPESKALDAKDRAEDYPQNADNRSPRWSRTRGVAQVIYRNSLAIAFLGMFALSFVLHVLTGTQAYNEQQALQNGDPPVSVATFFTTPNFWFQSMQNWQSEFLAMGCLIVLSIVLRQHGSPQSKPVTAPHSQTGQ
jgi:hypothetical protein